MTPAPTTLASASAASSGGRRYSLLDRLIAPADQALRTLSGAYESSRPYPAEGIKRFE